jgi:hypothetical protein
MQTKTFPKPLIKEKEVTHHLNSQELFPKKEEVQRVYKIKNQSLLMKI